MNRGYLVYSAYILTRNEARGSLECLCPMELVGVHTYVRAFPARTYNEISAIVVPICNCLFAFSHGQMASQEMYKKMLI